VCGAFGFGSAHHERNYGAAPRTQVDCPIIPSTAVVIGPKSIGDPRARKSRRLRFRSFGKSHTVRRHTDCGYREGEERLDPKILNSLLVASFLL